MSHSMQGMDTDQGRSIGQGMGQHAEQVSGIVSRVGSIVGAMKWQGADRETFLQDWQGSFAPQAENASQTLREQGDLLCRHAEAQDQASS